MSYQVLARRWRPQRFEDVVGQRAVTQTLRNALKSGRIAQAFVFAGPRGVGKTTTARILARALNCVEGPTPDPCGTCEPCREIADGRDIDVLEIDAATHTQVEKVREVIIDGLSIPPVRDRYKIFLIDEFHQLSGHSFNALLKAIEEPPPHVAFMMATTALDKIPDTIISRSHVFEFRLIAASAIAAQLRRIADAESIAVTDEALALMARAAEGSLRDAETAFDQVIAFAGSSITAEDVSAVLGLVGRDLLFEMVTAVANDDAAAIVGLVSRAVEAGNDLRLVCRELSRLVRDLLVIGVDRSRLEDPEIAPEADRERLAALAARFSREDLLRAFDVLARAEADIRNAAEPRYHLEMALLRWMYLQKIVPLAELIEGLEQGQATGPAQPPRAPAVRQPVAPARPAVTPRVPSPPEPAPRSPRTTPGSRTHGDGERAGESATAEIRDAFLAEIKKSKAVFYGTVVAQAQRIRFDPSCVVFSFPASNRLLGEQVQQNKAWLESIVERLTGRRVPVVAEVVGAGSDQAPPNPGPAVKPQTAEDLKAAALAVPAMQALLDVFPSEIREVREIERQQQPTGPAARLRTTS